MFSSLGRVKKTKVILRIQEGGPPIETYDRSTTGLESDRAKKRWPNQKLRKVYKTRSTKSVVIVIVKVKVIVIVNNY